jgi:hypothetical protein
VHGRNRHETVAETLALVGIMRHHTVLTGKELVTVVGAKFQYGAGSRSDQIQAAHCLPGQLVFDSCLLHTLPDWNPGHLQRLHLKPLPLAAKLRGLYGRTDPVDRLVNQVDSLLEMMGAGRGLKSDFGRSSNLLLIRLQYRKVDRVEGIAEFVSCAFDEYCASEARACDERLDDLSHELSRSADTATGEELTKKIHIAEQYLHLAQSRTFVPEAVTQQGFRDAVRDVVNN